MILPALLAALALNVSDLSSPPARDHQVTVIKNRRLERNQTVAKALYDANLDEATVDAVQGALKAIQFDFTKARPGDQLRFVFRDGQLDLLDYRRSAFKEWMVRRDGDRYVGRLREVEREQRVEVIELNVKTSIWDAAIAAGERPEIAVTLSDVFAWDIDFYRDVQKGDRMRAVIEKVVSKGRTVEYGNVLAASYVGSSVGNKRTFRYELPTGGESYFLEDGSSARKTFLKTPLKFAHVTSKFGSRVHPVLNYVKNHNGVDYGTPTGTPVWAVADGQVVRAGWDNGGGNTVCVKHVLSLETCYLHLSKIKVKLGERVPQKAIIGESGNTGMSTGPHLHFGMKRGGSYVNPLNQNFPRADPLPKDLVADYHAKISSVRTLLDAVPVAGRMKLESGK